MIYSDATLQHWTLRKPFALEACEHWSFATGCDFDAGVENYLGDWVENRWLAKGVGAKSGKDEGWLFLFGSECSHKLHNVSVNSMYWNSIMNISHHIIYCCSMVHILTFVRKRCWSFVCAMDPIYQNQGSSQLHGISVLYGQKQKSWDNACGHHMPAELSWWWSLTISSWQRIFPNCLHTVTIFASRTTCLLHPKICSWHSWSCWYSTTGQPRRVRCREPGAIQGVIALRRHEKERCFHSFYSRSSAITNKEIATQHWSFS